MTEVSQLNEMHAVLIASKESNDRKHEEAQQMTAKIAELEQRLEEGVAFTNRYRAAKTAATGGLRKRSQELDDLFIKLDHVAKQTSDVYLSRVAVTSEAVREHQRVVAQIHRDFTAAFERSNVLVERHRDCSEQEAKTKALAAGNRSKEIEVKELSNRVEELDAQSKVQDGDAVVADAARSATLKAIQSRQAERESLEKRLAAACASLKQNTVQFIKTTADIETADQAWNGDMMAMATDTKSIAAESQALELRRAELSNEIASRTADQLAKLEAEFAALTEDSSKLSLGLEEVKRQCKQDHPQVVEMRTQVQAKKQRRQLLSDQLAASQRVVASHSVNQPEFDTRVTEHKELSLSIAALKSAAIEAAARKAELDNDMHCATAEAEAAKNATKQKIAKLIEDGASIATARSEASASVMPVQAAIAKTQKEMDSIQVKAGETAAALENIARLELELNSQPSEQILALEKEIVQSEQATLEHQAEAKNVALAAENLEAESAVAKARAVETQQRETQAAKQAFLTEIMARKTDELTAEIEAMYADELKHVQDEIIREDTRLRAACADASQSASGGRTEERLQIDLSDLRAEEAAIRSDVEAAGLRIQRLREAGTGGQAVPS